MREETKAMENIKLNVMENAGKVVVKYLMKQKGGNVLGQTSPGSAMWMLTNDRQRKARMSGEFPGYPLTADGVYFFDGEIDGDGAVDTDAHVCGSDYCEIKPTDIGGDGLPIPAGDAEKPKRRKRSKDVVSE